MDVKGKKVISRDGKDIGTATGATYKCTMEGCTGMRISTRWPDGKNTRPCSKGMESLPDGSYRLM